MSEKEHQLLTTRIQSLNNEFWNCIFWSSKEDDNETQDTDDWLTNSIYLWKPL
jgi:hypothetical protein